MDKAGRYEVPGVGVRTRRGRLRGRGRSPEPSSSMPCASTKVLWYVLRCPHDIC